MKEFLRIIGFSFMAGILMFVGKNDIFLNWLIKVKVLSSEINVKNIQFWCFIIGFFWTGLWLPVQHYRLKSKQTKKDELFIELLDYNKNTYFELIKTKLKTHKSEFKTRIFKPQKGFIGWWNKNINQKVILELKTVKGISDNFHHKSLYFEVNKNEVQGLVGKSYSDKKLWVDLNLDENNYALTEQHISKIGDIGFCSTIPIFNADQTKVNAVLSVDSKEKFTFSDEQKREWETHMIYYGAFIDKHTNI